MRTNYLLVIAVISAAVLGSALLLSNIGVGVQNGMTPAVSATVPSTCAPESMDSFREAGYADVQTPVASLLPQGYRVEAIDYNGADLLHMYIADRAICQPEDLRTELESGSIIIEVANVPYLADEESEFHQTLANLNEQFPQMNATATKINGHNAIIWNQYTGSDRTILDGKVVKDDPLEMPAGLQIWDAKAHKSYHISGLTTYQELKVLAEGLSLSQ